MCKAHHWFIEPDTTPQSKGVCIHCEEQRVFNNLPRDLCVSTKDYVYRGQSVTFEHEVLGIMR